MTTAGYVICCRGIGKPLAYRRGVLAVPRGKFPVGTIFPNRAAAKGAAEAGLVAGDRRPWAPTEGELIIIRLETPPDEV